MRKCLALILGAVVCLAADVPSREQQPQPQFLVLKNGQRMAYDEITREGSTLFVRSGGHSVMIDAAEVVPPAATPTKAPEQ